MTANASTQNNTLTILYTIIFCWYILISLVRSFIGEIGLLNYIYLFIHLIIAYYWFEDIGIRKHTSAYKLVLCIWAYYIYRLFYDCKIGSYSHLNIKSYEFQFRPYLMYTIFYCSLAYYVYKNPNLISKILNKVLIWGTIGNVLLFLYCIIKYGLLFIALEATVWSNQITLINFSYNIVFFCIIALYQVLVKVHSKKINILCLFINIVLIISMGKRGSLMSIFIPGIAFWLFHNKSQIVAFRNLFILCLIYALFTEFHGQIFDMIESLNTRLGSTLRLTYEEGDSNGRDVLWENTLKQIEHNPLWGTYPKIIVFPPTHYFYGIHPHNIWLESIMTMGWIGSIPLFLLVIYCLIYKVPNDIKKKNIYTFFALYFLSEIIHGTFSGTLYNNYIWLCMLVILYEPKKNKKIW